MRYRTLGWIILAGMLGALPVAAHADYLSNAKSALKSGDLKSAQIELRNAVRSDPQNAEAHYWLGRVALELGDPVAAEREVLAARDRGFDPHQTVPLLSQTLLTQGKYDRLLETLKTDGKDADLDASILVSRAFALMGLKRPDDAQQALSEAEQTAPNAVEPLLADARLAISHADLNGAQSKIDRALAAQPKSAEALLAKAQVMRLKNDATAAMAVLDELLTDQPTVTQARLERASLELAIGRGEAAKLDIEQVLKGTPGNIQAIYLRAVVETQARNFKAADLDLEKITSYLGRIQRGYYLQAVVKEQLGQLEQAEEVVQRYIARAPNDLAGYKVLARVQLAKKRPDQVIETLAKVVESGRGDAEGYDLLGRAYALTGQQAEAVKSFQKAESLAPNDIGLQTRLASVRMGTGDVDSAVGDLEHTLELAPKLPAVGEALFFAALATGNLDRAQDALTKIRAAQGDTDIVGNLAGLLQLAHIDLTGGEATFLALIKKYPDFIPAKVNYARILSMRGQGAEAETVLGAVLQSHPTSEPSLSMMVNAFLSSGRMPQAIALLEGALKSEPANGRVLVALGDLYIRSGKPQQALDLANSQRTTTVEMLSLRAAAQLALGLKKEATGTYITLLKQDPTVAGARRQLVAMVLDSGDFESARQIVTAGIAIAPRNYQMYQDLALIDLRAEGLDKALATADRLVTQDTEFSALRALKGDIFLAANRPEEAIVALTEAQAAFPSDTLVTRLAGAQLRTGRTADAMATLEGWTAKHPEDVVATEQLAEISIALNKLEPARKHLEAILALKPHDPVALNNLAWTYQQLGDERAQGLARQAYVLQPSAQTADTLGWIMTASGKADVGVSLLRQASMEQKVDPRVLYHYAVALKDTGNKGEAIKQLNAVLGTKGEFKEKTEAKLLLETLNKGS